MNQVPEFLRNARTLQDPLKGMGGSMPAHLSIRGNRFALIDANNNRIPVAENHLDVMIVDVNPNVAKLYYKDAFDTKATEFAPPTCYSNDGEAPAADAQEQQNDVCLTCKHNEWGSKISPVSGAKTKACQDGRKIAVYPVDPKLPQMPFMFHIKPGSFSTYKAMVQTVQKNGAAINHIIVRMTFADGENGKIEFMPKGWIDEKLFEIQNALDETQLGGMTGRLAAPVSAPAPQLSQAAKPAFLPAGETQTIAANEVGTLNSVVGEQPKPRTRRTKAEMEAARAAEAAQQAPQAPQSASQTVEPKWTPENDPAEAEETAEQREFREWQEAKRASQARAQAASDAIREQPKPAEQVAKFGMVEVEPVTDDALSKAIDDALALPTG